MVNLLMWIVEYNFEAFGAIDLWYTGHVAFIYYLLHEY